jgi:hypothetical protein
MKNKSIKVGDTFTIKQVSQNIDFCVTGIDEYEVYCVCIPQFPSIVDFDDLDATYIAQRLGVMYCCFNLFKIDSLVKNNYGILNFADPTSSDWVLKKISDGKEFEAAIKRIGALINGKDSLPF